MSEVIKISDAIASFLKDKEIRHVFGIIGSANAHIFDSIVNLGYTQIICVHHEQAATMAMQSYFRMSGKITAAIVTAGAGSSNAITGVMSAWGDSMPGIVISGQENVRFLNGVNGSRLWGIQGYDSTAMVEKITKYATRIVDPEQAIYELEKAYFIAGNGRPGPVWLDYPMDIQGKKLPAETVKHFTPPQEPRAPIADKSLSKVVELIKSAKRPVFWLGQGIRLSGAQAQLAKLLEALPFPFLVTWAGVDMLPDAHPLNFGRAGIYGNRAANFVVQNSDLVIAIGNRMTIPMIGYEHSEFAREAKIVQVDIDQSELDKLREKVDVQILADAKDFITSLISVFEGRPSKASDVREWVGTCEGYRTRYPYLGPEHDDKNGYINSYRFLEKLSETFKPDQVITTDMGTALLSGFECLKIRGTQRLFTSTGLGEMGYGLPSAIGASFATDKGEVICLNCDGGMMLNLQELQTIAHHQLPIKIFVFNNDGYLMIKHTQKNLFQGRYSGTHKDSGVTCPDYGKIASGFDIPYFAIKTWDDFDAVTPKIRKINGPVMCDVFMDPEQFFYPKLSLAIKADGSIVSPPLEDLSPLLPRDVLKKEMLIGLHPKSEGLN